MTGTMPAVWLLDAVTTIGAFGLLAIGLYLLARSGSFRAPKSGAHWTAIAILLFVAARWANYMSGHGDVLWTPGKNR